MCKPLCYKRLSRSYMENALMVVYETKEEESWAKNFYSMMISTIKKIWEVMNFLWITKITQTFMSHGWICNMLILHRLKEIAIQNKEWINLGNDELMHMKEETY